MTTPLQNLDPNVAGIVGPIVDNPVVRFLFWLSDFIDTLTLSKLMFLGLAALALYVSTLALYDILILEPKRVAKNNKTLRRR